MTGLVDTRGRPLSSGFTNKKADPPKLGEAFGDWAGRDQSVVQLPGGGIVQFDLSKLTLSDYRTMRDHYQVNASLAVLSFMQHQSEWHVECEDKAIASKCEELLRAMWTPLNRSMATANWAGYSPAVLEWESDYETRSVMVNKVKDLRPEDCAVNWKLVEGWAPPGRVKPKFKIYDGIKYAPNPGWPIPVENTFWYPLLMEEGDYYGRKLLRPAFTSWFFSLLVHLFANRYYERFGEPTPIGRAPFDEEIDSSGGRMQGNDYMMRVLQSLRSRSAVVLPNDKSQLSDSSYDYDYDIEYLESQMRGADFERYMTRLDEEISIGLFTPILLLRTADVGSYNLGVGHMQIYLWMLNAMNDDRKQYIDRYVLRKMVDYNFSPKAPSARIIFQKMGKADGTMVSAVVSALISGGKAKPDLDELGKLAGMSLTEIRQTTQDTTDPAATGATGDGTTGPAQSGTSPGQTARTVKEIINRVRPQVEKAMREDRFGPDLQINMGYKNQFQRSLEADGVSRPSTRTEGLYNRMDYVLSDLVSLGPSEFSSPDAFVDLFGTMLDNEVKELVK